MPGDEQGISTQARMDAVSPVCVSVCHTVCALVGCVCQWLCAFVFCELQL
jgi:hypothetical protein